MNENKICRQPSVDGRTVRQDYPNDYPQDKELSSINEDLNRMLEALQQQDWSKLPDDIRVVQVHPHVVLDIPDRYEKPLYDLLERSPSLEGSLGMDGPTPEDYLD